MITPHTHPSTHTHAWIVVTVNKVHTKCSHITKEQLSFAINIFLASLHETWFGPNTCPPTTPPQKNKTEERGHKDRSLRIKSTNDQTPHPCPPTTTHTDLQDRNKNWTWTCPSVAVQLRDCWTVNDCFHPGYFPKTANYTDHLTS